MINQGLIAENKADQSKVLVFREEACGSCASCGACKTKPKMIWLDNSLGAKPGDMVVLEMDNKQFFRSAFLLFGLPLILFIAGILISHFVQLGQTGTSNDMVSFLGGLVGLFIYWLVARKLDSGDVKDKVKMVRIADVNEEAYDRYLEGGF